MICPKCGKENDNLQTVCVYCGEPLTPGFIMCSVCGKVLKEGDAICPRCHSKVYEMDKSLKEKRQNQTRTPMYLGKVPGSFIVSLFILVSTSILLGLYIHMYMGTLDQRVFPIIGISMSIGLSLITFMCRVLLNTTRSIDKLDSRVNGLKNWVVSEVTTYILLGVFIYLPMLVDKTSFNIYEIALFVVYSLTLLIIVIFTPIFFIKARVRSR